MNCPPSTTAALHGWNALLADPPTDLARDHLEQLAELEAAWPGLAHGDRSVHGDPRADNMARDPHPGVTFVDWAHATTGPGCSDAAFLALNSSSPGRTPADVARLLHDHPANVGPDTTTAFPAALTGHWHRLVVRNCHRRRIVVTAAGPAKVTAPRLDDRRVDEITGEPGAQQQQSAERKMTSHQPVSRSAAPMSGSPVAPDLSGRRGGRRAADIIREDFMIKL